MYICLLYTSNLAFFEDRDKSETATLIIRKDISAGGPITVSYTHLDVYKRQGPGRQRSG